MKVDWERKHRGQEWWWVRMVQRSTPHFRIVVVDGGIKVALFEIDRRCCLD
jgi:hypothetical protein